jgi:hypothetical protein
MATRHPASQSCPPVGPHNPPPTRQRRTRWSPRGLVAHPPSVPLSVVGRSRAQHCPMMRLVCELPPGPHSAHRVGEGWVTWEGVCWSPQPTNVSLQHYRGLHAQPTQRPGAQSRGLVRKRLSNYKITLHLDSGVAETTGRVQLGVGEWDERVCVKRPNHFFRQCTSALSAALTWTHPDHPDPASRWPHHLNAFHQPHGQHDGDAIYKVDDNRRGERGGWGE